MYIQNYRDDVSEWETDLPISYRERLSYIHLNQFCHLGYIVNFIILHCNPQRDQKPKRWTEKGEKGKGFTHSRK